MAEQAELDHFRPHLDLESIEQLPPDRFLRYWAGHIAAVFHDSMAKPGDSQFPFVLAPSFTIPSRKPDQILESHFQGIDYRLKLKRDALKGVQILMGTESGQARLFFELTQYALPTALIDMALRGFPRGHKHSQARREFMCVAQCAVFAARELIVAWAQKDRALRARLLEVCENDLLVLYLLDGLDGVEVTCQSPAVQRRLVMALADRALRPAITHYGLKPLSQRDISEILDAQASEDLARFFSNVPPGLEGLGWWFDALLGPEGEAARRLNLLPSH